MVLDGKVCANHIYEQLKNHPNISRAGLAIITIGEDDASKVYVRNKIRAAEKIGLLARQFIVADDASTEDVCKLIWQLNFNEHYTGIIIQLPVPKHVDVKAIQEAIVPEKDVDGFRANSPFNPCTPEGILYLMDYYNIDSYNKKCVILGRSDIVGKPMARMMLDRDNTVSVCHSKTPEKVRNSLCQTANIIISAVGKPYLIGAEELTIQALTDASGFIYRILPQKQILIDVGINRNEENKLCGDFNPNVYEFAEAYSPVPGGVGPMTVAMLMKHTVEGPHN